MPRRERVRRAARGRGLHRPPAWGCGEPTCWAYRWQPVSAMGEYDPVDVALGDLEAHYNHEHPELAAEEVTPIGHALAA